MAAGNKGRKKRVSAESQWPWLPSTIHSSSGLYLLIIVSEPEDKASQQELGGFQDPHKNQTQMAPRYLQGHGDQGVEWILIKQLKPWNN